MDYERYIRRQLKEKNFSDTQIQQVIDVVIDLFPAEKDDSLSLIKYAEKKFEEKFGGEDVFCTFPMAPQIMRNVTDFKAKNGLDGKKYRGFIEWIMLEGESKIHRLPILHDLYNSKLFSIFVDKGKEEVVEQKKKVQKKNLLIIQ